MSRENGDWLDAYLRFTENSEPPTSYHTWCGLSAIAGSLQRKVWLSWGFETIYPNMFVILVGPSGRTRKGIALNAAKDILRGVPTVSISPESSSGREAMILAQKRAMANFEDPVDGVIKFHCSLTTVSEELSVFLGEGDLKFLANLTDWYDSKDFWEYETVGRGKDSLQGLCFNLVGGTAPDWLQSMLPFEAIGGGFTRRVIFIVEERKKQTVPKHHLSDKEILLRGTLINDLNRINQLSGPFHFSPEGEKAYTTWYAEQDALLDKGKLAVPDQRFAAYCDCRATHIRKIMMACSASRGDSLSLEKEDFDRALGYLTNAEANMARTFGGLGKARHGDVTESVFKYIEQVGITTRSLLLAKFYRDVDPETLRRIEDIMQQMKICTIELRPDRGEKIYKWVGRQQDKT